MLYLSILIILITIAITIFLYIKNNQLQRDKLFYQNQSETLNTRLNELITRNTELTTNTALYKEKLEYTENLLREIKEKSEILLKEKENLITEKSTLEERVNGLSQQLKTLENSILEYRQKIIQYDEENKKLTQRNNDLNARYAANEIYTKELENKFHQLTNEYKLLQDKLKTEFENVMHKLIEQNTIKLTEQNQKILMQSIAPFKENINQIKELEQKIQNYYNEENKDRASLKSLIEVLLQQSNEVKQTADKLASALSSQVKYQGNWGEMILERLLELSGLQRNIEYIIQYKENDKQPDVIIKLPNKKYLIIDSKVTLNAYVKYISASTDEEKSEFANEIITSIRNHITNLSKKEYEKLDGISTLDFVLMFVPIENVMNIALQYQIDLWNEAINKRILIVTPTSLLATLKTIYYIWQQEKQRRDFENILKAIHQLHNKLRIFSEHFTGIEKALNKALECYRDAKGSLTEGSGNAMSIIKKKIEPYINPKTPITQLSPSDADEE